MANPAFIRSEAMRFGHYVSYAGNSRTQALYLRPNEADHSRRMRLTDTLNGLSSALASNSRCIVTCCGTLAATPWPTLATIQGRCKIGSAIGTFNTQCAIPNWPRDGSRTFGGTNHPFRLGPKKRKLLNDFSRVCACACVLGDVRPLTRCPLPVKPMACLEELVKFAAAGQGPPSAGCRASPEGYAQRREK